MLCKQDKCEHWGHATKYPRKCWYGEPMCWKGQVDAMLFIFKERFKKHE
jgi:hypothetical protein